MATPRCTSPLKLSKNYYAELLRIKFRVPVPGTLRSYLSDLIYSHLNNTPPPRLTHSEIYYLKKIKLDGIELSDHKGKVLYDIMVFVQKDPTTGSPIGILVPKHPGKELKYLKDL